MRRVILAALLLVMCAGCLPMGGELGASTTIPSNMTPDLSYIPKDGDRVILYGIEDGAELEQVPVLADITAYDKYERMLQANDFSDISNLKDQNELLQTPAGTRVMIAKIFDRTHTGARPAAEVRMLDGPLKGRTLIASIAYLTRLKKIEEPK